ncbi:MAG: 50S rRNA methyltransferase [Methanolinea sp. SDB]|nr:MAG: 50S rRNA methyltransferase [Methanolinea sp. SDB]
MQIRIIAVGRTKEHFLKEGIAEYTKRLSLYCRVEIKEVQEEKLPEPLSRKELNGAMQREAERISRAINRDSLVVVLDPGGLPWTSEEFARQIAGWKLSGRSQLVFIIGGASGLSKGLIDNADICLSLSPMTFTHQMSRLILLEQIYRAFRISRGEPYHR